MRLPKMSLVLLLILLGLSTSSCTKGSLQYQGCVFGAVGHWVAVDCGVRKNKMDFFVIQFGSKTPTRLCKCDYIGAQRIIRNCVLSIFGEEKNIIGSKKLYILSDMKVYTFPVKDEAFSINTNFSNMNLEALTLLVDRIAGEKAAQILRKAEKQTLGLGVPASQL